MFWFQSFFGWWNQSMEKGDKTLLLSSYSTNPLPETAFKVILLLEDGQDKVILQAACKQLDLLIKILIITRKEVKRLKSDRETADFKDNHSWTSTSTYIQVFIHHAQDSKSKTIKEKHQRLKTTIVEQVPVCTSMFSSCTSPQKQDNQQP